MVSFGDAFTWRMYLGLGRHKTHLKRSGLFEKVRVLHLSIKTTVF